MAAPCKPRIRDIAILGFAYFATYFGAGNLIFPPLLGLNSGSSFFSGLVGLTLSGVFLPIFTLIVIGLNGNVHAITDHVGKYTYNILLAALMLVCTFVSIPRTCATAIQLGIQGNIPAAPFIPLVILYFLISFFFSLDKNRVMDRMGKYLTPLLALILVIISVLGIIHPLGTPGAPSVPQPFVNAFLGGYNTGDVLVSFIMASVFITAIGQIAAVAEFTNQVCPRISYGKAAAACCLLSALTALLGVDGIVTYIGWIFGVCYPPCLALLVLGIFSRILPNDGAYKGSVCLVTLYALLESLPGLSGLAWAKALVSITPLSAYGFGWIVPFLIGLVAGSLLWSFRRPAVKTADV